MNYSNDEKEKIISGLARDIINLARSSVLVTMKFMGTAINRVRTKESEDAGISCDGETLHYNPHYVVSLYKQDKNMFTRQYMHTIMHCVFRHMFVGNGMNLKAWDTACDIAVENMLNELEVESITTDKCSSQKIIISDLKKIKPFTAEKLYHEFIEKKYTDEELDELREDFCADNHSAWYASPSSSNVLSAKKMDMNKEELMQMWKAVSEQMQLDLETFSKEHGENAADFIKNLKALNRERYNYRSFLEKFSVMGEKMMINSDEFEYNFYTYGLELYGNMPLIEPLEYKDVKLVKEFVIAIDTSGSTSGELVQKFVQKTYNILIQQENFFNKINVHIIQCDAAIQEDKKITNQEEFQEYINTMQIHGLGGTDFRPVFSYVTSLIEMGEFTNLKGMIYFTDGYGDFPRKKPAYETAFVFVNDDEDYTPEVPSWAIKLVLTTEEIEDNN